MIYLIKVGNPRCDDIEMIISAKDKSKEQILFNIKQLTDLNRPKVDALMDLFLSAFFL